jgi:Fe-S cluster assembly scaffold protein SufB
MEALDMIINELPSLTWNHLHMNQTKVEQVVIKESGTYEIEKSAQVEVVTTGILAEKYGEMATGSGKEIDRLAVLADIHPVIYQVGAGQTVKEPVKLHFDYEDGAQVMNQVGFQAEENASVTVFMDYQADRASQGTGAVQTKLYAGKNATIRLVQVQRIGDGTRFFNDIGGYCEEGGHIEILQLILSGQASYMGCQIDLAGKNSSMKSDIGYMVEGGHKLDINYLVRHLGENTQCDIQAGGSLREGAEKIFRGTIDFVHGSSGSVGNEKEEVLLLDEDCINKTIPLILCAVEDVVGNHGATIGRPDEELLLYLGSRGIPEKEAINMLARAKVDAVAGMIWEEGFRQEILDYIKGETE